MIKKTLTPWKELGIGDEIQDLLIKQGLDSPTPVQSQSIAFAMDGKDLIVSAPTGTGKTLAFLLPVLEKVKGRKGTYALILAPSREIALQTQKAASDLCGPLGIDSISLIGGTDLDTDEVNLRNYPQIIIATPGRLCDHLERGNVWLEYIEVLVLDEADRMFEMGFSEQLNKIINATSPEIQTLLFSATISPKVESLCKKILKQPIRIQIEKKLASTDPITQSFIQISEQDKFNALRKLLRTELGTVFVFTRSKDRTAKLWRDLRNRGFHEATQIHSNLKQNVREEALNDFKTGKYRVLIATDVVGRGIHVDNVAHVVNYDLPREASDYIHRIGRTGRTNCTGISTSFVTPRDAAVVMSIKKLIGAKNK